MSREPQIRPQGIRKPLAPPAPPKRILPSIRELEEILDREGNSAIKILPNGEIRTKEKGEVNDESN